MAKRKDKKAENVSGYEIGTVDAPPVRFRSSPYDEIVTGVKAQLDKGVPWATVTVEDESTLNAIRNRIRSTIGIPTKSRIVGNIIYIAASAA